MKEKILVLVETSRTYGRQTIDGITRYAKENGRWAIYLEDHGLQYGNKYRAENVRWDGIISRTVNSPGANLSGKQAIPASELPGDSVFSFSDILCVDLLGHYYCVILDIYSDLTHHSSQFGSHFEFLEMSELKKLRDDLTDSEIDIRYKKFLPILTYKKTVRKAKRFPVRFSKSATQTAAIVFRLEYASLSIAGAVTVRPITVLSTWDTSQAPLKNSPN